MLTEVPDLDSGALVVLRAMDLVIGQGITTDLASFRATQIEKARILAPIVSTRIGTNLGFAIGAGGSVRG